MKIQQIYTGCLAQGAYYIESEGEAAIIDPLREVSPYLKKAEEDNAKIKYIFETHFHADFVSGHLTLAEKTGAPIIYGKGAETDFDVQIAENGDRFPLGKLTIVALHTPGHTLESTSYLLKNENGKDIAIFTGDTLFLGDVGRPDLAQKMEKLTKEDLAGMLFDSLREKIMPLGDDLIVYPGHGAGSACGKKMMKETIDTLGNQKKVNYALRTDMSKTEFIAEVTDGLQAPPAYFPANVLLNKNGYQSIDNILKKGNIPLNPAQFEEVANTQDALVLDVRTPQAFAKQHIPNSIFIGLNGSFAPWVGELIVDVQHPILLVVEEGKEQEAITRLSRIGFDNTLGFLEGGIEQWVKSGRETDHVNSISATKLAAHFETVKQQIFDVRKINEFSSKHVIGAKNAPLSEINSHLPLFSKEEKMYVHCASGYRSMIANSILKSRGFHNVVDVQGGFKSLDQTIIPKSEFVCPSTL